MARGRPAPLARMSIVQMALEARVVEVLEAKHVVGEVSRKGGAPTRAAVQDVGRRRASYREAVAEKRGRSAKSCEPAAKTTIKTNVPRILRALRAKMTDFQNLM